MSNISSKFNRSNYGVIVPYQGGHYEAYVTPFEEDGVTGVLVAYHKAFDAMPAFESDFFPTVETADEYICTELSGVQLRKVRNPSAEDEY